MSFKYRLILSYIIVEVFFITLIVGVNFTALNSTFTKLTKEKIETNISFIEELVKVPLSVYDIATLDNLVDKVITLNDISSIMIFDRDENLISGKNKLKSLENFTFEDFKKNYNLELQNDKSIKYIKVFEDKILLGSFGIVFDLSSNKNFIEENRLKTIVLIFIEILISLIISYFIGARLTKNLTNLSIKAKEIGEDKNPEIPYLNLKNEIGVLARSMDKMKKDLKNRNDNIIQMQKQKDNFFANMSHELKTPLNSINIISSIMMNSNNVLTEEKRVKNLKIINKCGNDLLTLINDILDISKLEDGKIKLNCQNFDFSAFFDDIVLMFKNVAKQKNIEFTIRVNKDIGTIYNDEIRIRQIIVNLLGNAFKFTLQGSVSVVVEDLKDFIKVSVKDTGIGIQQDKLETIFERFKQVDEGISRKFGGTGLGLSISKELATLLQGSIEVKSVLDKGSEFIFIFPKNIYEVDNKVMEQKRPQIKENIEILENKKSFDIVFLNKDLLKFMTLIVDLRREVNKFIQINSIDKFKIEYKNKQIGYLMVNISDFQQSDILEIIDTYSYKKLIIIKDKTCDEKIESRANLSFELPMNENEFLEKFSKI